jgi:uncharacterized protein with HEPN domain
MAKPTPKERLEHILEAIEHIKAFLTDIDEQSFIIDVKIQSAVQFQFLIIGEAIRFIDDDILVKYHYPWHIPRSFRNFIIHVYHGIKIERIYYAARDLGELEKQITLILKNEFI